MLRSEVFLAVPRHSLAPHGTPPPLSLLKSWSNGKRFCLCVKHNFRACAFAFGPVISKRGRAKDWSAVRGGEIVPALDARHYGEMFKMCRYGEQRDSDNKEIKFAENVQHGKVFLHVTQWPATRMEAVFSTSCLREEKGNLSKLHPLLDKMNMSTYTIYTVQRIKSGRKCFLRVPHSSNPEPILLCNYSRLYVSHSYS